MNVVIITLEEGPTDEVQTLKELISRGIIVHLRKKKWSKERLQEYMKQFSSNEKRSITLHGPLNLAQDLGAGGVHSADAKRIANSPLRTSQSAHELNELTQAQNMDYIFLSPIYDSISKKEYKGDVDLEAFKHLVQQSEQHVPVIALGGVTPDKYQELISLGFSGIALCGAFWSRSFDERIELVNQW